MCSVRVIGFAIATTSLGLLACREEGNPKADPSLEEMLSGDGDVSRLEDFNKDAELRLKILRGALEHVAPKQVSDKGSLYKNRFFRTDRSFFIEVEREDFPLKGFLRVFAERSEQHGLGKMLVVLSLKKSETRNVYRIKKFFIESGGFSELSVYE